MTAADIDWRDFNTFGDRRVTPTEPAPDNPIVFHPQAGDAVKLVWPPGESMWVRVDCVGELGKLTGTLDNIPVVVPLDYGDRIWFNTSDILQQMSAPGEGAA